MQIFIIVYQATIVKSVKMVGMEIPLMPLMPYLTTAARSHTPADNLPSINSLRLPGDGLPTCVNCTVGHRDGIVNDAWTVTLDCQG